MTMKRIGLHIPLFLLFFLLAQRTFADVTNTVTTGNATAVVNVSNTIGGGTGSVTTHVETDVNGNTNIFDSNTPGSYTIESNGSTTTVTTPSTTVSSTQESTPSPTATLHTEEKGSVHSFWARIKNWLKSIFSFL